MAPDGSGFVGNTNDNKTPEKKRCNAAKNWTFTYNNYTAEGYEWLQVNLPKIAKLWIMGKEKGKQGTPHIQGYFTLEKKRRPTELIGGPCKGKIHYEIAKCDLMTNYKYCSKEGDFITNIPGPVILSPLNVITNLSKWQTDILNLITTEINDRVIFWLCDKKGGRGKTALLKYMDAKFKCVISTVSNKSDVATLIRGAFYNDKDELIHDINGRWFMLFNFQKDYTYNSLNYDTLEAVKDGLITATKYRGKNLNFNSPIVLVMANEYPIMDINKRIKTYEFNDLDEITLLK